MHAKLIYSLQSLQSWIERIEAYGKGKDPDLQDFIEAHDIQGLIIFYTELIPFVNEISMPLPNGINIAEEFSQKLVAIKAATIIRKNIFSFFSNNVGYIKQQSSNKLLSELHSANQTITNVIYLLKINS